MPAANESMLPARPSRLRKRLRKLALVVALLASTGFLLCTTGWSWINTAAVSYAESCVDSQLEQSASELPEIADQQALIQQEIQGSNGWLRVIEGRRCLHLLLRAKAKTPDGLVPWWLDTFTRDIGIEGWEETKLEPKSPEYPHAGRFEEFLALTADLPAYADMATRCDCIVRTENDWDGEFSNHFPRTSSFVKTLANRVRILAHLGRREDCNRELLGLVRLLNRFTDRYCKWSASAWISTRNEVLECVVVPLLKEGAIDVGTAVILAELRWKTPGTDPKLWLNNAAFTYRFIFERREGGYAGFEGQDTATFPKLGSTQYYLRGYAQWMAVCTQNAIDAREGRLDLRDESWVKAYNLKFAEEDGPINGAVG